MSKRLYLFALVPVNIDVFKWGDAENAIDYWANLTDQRMVAFGVQTNGAAAAN